MHGNALTAASRERDRIGARQREFDEAKHKRDATGKFTFKEGGNSGSSRGRISGRRRESGASFGDRAYRRAAEREAEEAAKKKSSGGGNRLSDEERARREAEKKQKAAEREAERKRREAEREAERKKREAERAERELQRAAERRISNPDQSGGKSSGSTSGVNSDDSRVEGVITPAMQRSMTEAARGIKVTGADNVTDAVKAYNSGDETYRKGHVATLPFDGSDREEFLDVIRSRYSPVRVQINEDGSGWFLDDTGLLWKF